MTRIITITSGKGGVGKTSISLNLALSMAAMGFKTAVFDADLGLANINILTGIYPKKHLVDVIEGRCTLKDIIIKDYQGIDIIPGSTGIESLANLSPQHANKLIKAFVQIKPYDYIFFDTSAGISAQVISFCLASNEIYLIITGQPTSVTDAYSMLKVLSKNKYKNFVNIILNQINSVEEARHIYKRLENTIKKFLSIKLRPAGVIPVDRQVGMAVNAQIPFVMLFPDSKASKSIRAIVRKIERHFHGEDISMALFWKRCFAFFQNKQLDDALDNSIINYGDVPIDDKVQISNQGNALNSFPARGEQVSLKNLEKKMDEIETEFLELFKQFSKLKRKVESMHGNQFLVLDFEQWLKKHSLTS